MAKKTKKLITQIVKRFTDEILNINWNHHLLSEFTVSQAKRHGFDEMNKPM